MEATSGVVTDSLSTLSRKMRSEPVSPGRVPESPGCQQGTQQRPPSHLCFTRERRYPGCRERAHQIPGMDCAGLDAARVSLGLSTWGSEELMLQHGPLGSQGSEVIRGACCARSWTSKAGVPERRVKAGVSYPGCQEFCPRCRTGTSVFGGCGKKHEHRS